MAEALIGLGGNVGDVRTTLDRAVAAFATVLAPKALLQRALAVEAGLGRDRATGRRWGPRPVDIDILAYDDLVLDGPDLSLPHPRMKDRAFVLVPLAEIAPDWRVDGERIADLAARIDATGVTRLPARP